MRNHIPALHRLLVVFSDSFHLPYLHNRFSGEATYKSQTKFELNLDSTRIPPERIKEIKQRMKDALIKDYTLTFNKTSSVFKEVEQLEQGDSRGPRFMMMVTGGGGVVYKKYPGEEGIGADGIFWQSFPDF